ncbi:MAG: hypothetical protein MHM6MM_002906 [Cercozoa sp. M6MM]
MICCTYSLSGVILAYSVCAIVAGPGQSAVGLVSFLRTIAHGHGLIAAVTALNVITWTLFAVCWGWTMHRLWKRFDQKSTSTSTQSNAKSIVGTEALKLAALSQAWPRDELDDEV